MKQVFVCVAVGLLLLCLCRDARAHRVNIFASVEGDLVRVECGFSRSQKVKNGRIVVTDATTGVQVLEGLTDADGIFSFRPPEDIPHSGHALIITIDAGTGHRNDWTISASELQALGAASAPVTPQPPATPSARPTLVAPDTTAPLAPAGDAARFGLSERELEAVINRTLDARLAPVNRALAQLQERGTDFRDVIGGIGWILGLIGLAAYMKYRCS